MKDSEDKNVGIRLICPELHLYANPMILMLIPGKQKRVLPGKWFQEIIKSRSSFIKSIEAIEVILNMSSDQITAQNYEIVQDNMVFFVNTLLLHLFSCFDKFAQMCRCYLEAENAYNPIVQSPEKICKCGELISKSKYFEEDNTSFISFYKYIKEHEDDQKFLFDAFRSIIKSEQYSELKDYRNGFVHKMDTKNQSVGLTPDQINIVKEANSVTTTALFGGTNNPSPNWFRVESVALFNVFIDALNTVGMAIFPVDFELKDTSNELQL